MAMETKMSPIESATKESVTGSAALSTYHLVAAFAETLLFLGMVFPAARTFVKGGFCYNKAVALNFKRAQRHDALIKRRNTRYHEPILCIVLF